MRPSSGELNGLGGYYDPSTYDPNKQQFLDPGTFTRLKGYRYIEDGAAPEGILRQIKDAAGAAVQAVDTAAKAAKEAVTGKPAAEAPPPAKSALFP